MQTGATAADEIADGIQAGVFYYLTKPYQEQALLSIVQSALQTHEQHDLFMENLTRQSDVISNMTQGVFNLRTPDEAQDLAFLLGSVFPRKELAVMGLHELLLNAVEHGLLEIGYELKTQLLLTRKWDQEIRKRLHDDAYQGKQITVQFQQNADEWTITITDPGNGFEWQNYLQIEPSRATKPNGRGIAKAHLLAFDQLNYNLEGNVVTVTSRRHL